MDNFQKHYWDYAEGICIALRSFQKANELTNAQMEELIIDIECGNIELFPEQDAG